LPPPFRQEQYFIHALIPPEQILTDQYRADNTTQKKKKDMSRKPPRELFVLLGEETNKKKPQSLIEREKRLFTDARQTRLCSRVDSNETE